MLGALAILVLLGADIARRAVIVRRELVEANVALTRVRGTVGPLLRFDASAWPDGAGYERLVGDVSTAHDHLVAARSALGYLRWPARAMGVVPVVGEQFGVAPRALDLGIDVTKQTGTVLAEGRPLFAGQGKIAERAREVLVVRGPELDRALAALEADAAELERLRSVRWMGPMSRVGRLLDAVSGDLKQIGTARALATAATKGLDPLLGFDRPRTYLVLGQNEQEIRPTGGFLGTMGVIVIDKGRMVSSDYRSSYEFDPPTPPRRRLPEELIRYMGAGGWYVRDANWDADFPTSARRILDFVKADRNIDADGVVAVNTPMVQLLLGATGSMRVEGVDTPLTPENFIALLEEEIFENWPDNIARKRQLLQPVLRELISRVQDANAERVPPLIGAFTRGARSRDLQVFARDDRSAAMIAAIGVDGRIQPKPGRDFLAVVDSNVSYDKIQIAIRREITYVSRADGRVDVLVRWTNERSTFSGARYRRLGVGGELWDHERKRMVSMPGVFGNYVRIYVPAGSTFEEMQGFSSPPGLVVANGVSVLSGMVVVPDGKTVSLRFTYLPGGDASKRSTGVDVWKQGGQTRDELRVFLAAPRNTQITPYSGVFDRDMSFEYPARTP